MAMGVGNGLNLVVGKTNSRETRRIPKADSRKIILTLSSRLRLPQAAINGPKGDLAVGKTNSREARRITKADSRRRILTIPSRLSPPAAINRPKEVQVAGSRL
jgi:hypothetical protein